MEVIIDMETNECLSHRVTDIGQLTTLAFEAVKERLKMLSQRIEFLEVQVVKLQKENQNNGNNKSSEVNL